ncbi:hypothetical protein CIB48_g6235 [Xylaria polymorpha]|nr:hypothetical protein CIB48_g6235 [Xylaria polymorpha]
MRDGQNAEGGVAGRDTTNLRRAGGAARRYRRDGVRCARLASLSLCTNEWPYPDAPISGLEQLENASRSLRARRCERSGMAMT